VASAHGRSTPGERKWEVLGWRGLSESIFAPAVPAWYRTVHRTVFYRLGSTDAAPTQPQGRSGKHNVASAHGRSTPGERKWEVLGWRGLSESIFAPAVPAWYRTVHRTVFYRLGSKVRSPKYTNTPDFQKIRSVPS